MAGKGKPVTLESAPSTEWERLRETGSTQGELSLLVQQVEIDKAVQKRGPGNGWKPI